MESLKNKFVSSEKLCEHSWVKFRSQFHFISNNFKCFIRNMKFVFDIWCCQKLFCLEDVYNSRLQYNVNNLGTKFLPTCYSNV